jgi:hypothetical protein
MPLRKESPASSAPAHPCTRKPGINARGISTSLYVIDVLNWQAPAPNQTNKEEAA